MTLCKAKPNARALLVLALATTFSFLGPRTAQADFGFLGKWQLSHSPKAVAVDSAGDVWTADSVGAIQKFTPYGDQLDNWQSQTGPSELESPQGLTADSEANVYVADWLNWKIQKFSSSGKYLDEWGQRGFGEKDFSHPNGVGVDLTDNIYVSDWNDFPIRKFNAEGEFIWALDGEYGECCSQANGVDVDASGNIYIVDSGHHMVRKFDQNRTPIDSLGREGDDEGEFYWPQGVAVAPSGEIYVSDGGNDRIQKFRPDGGRYEYVSEWGEEGSENGQFSDPQGIALDAAGNLYVADKGNDRIQKFNSDGGFLTAWGSYGLDSGQFADPYALTVDPAGDIYVSDQDNDRIQKFNSNGGFVLEWGSPMRSSLESPQSIALDSEDNVFVIDGKETRYRFYYFVHKFSKEGEFIARVGGQEGSEGSLVSPDDIDFDSLGNAYIADGDHVKKFRQLGEGYEYVSEWGDSGDSEGQFRRPVGIAVDKSDNIYVVEDGNARVQKFDSNGDFKSMWGWGVGDGSQQLQVCVSSCQAGISGNGSGQFSDPRDVEVDSINSVYVADSNGRAGRPSSTRIEKFDSKGTLLYEWGSYGGGYGQFDYPLGVAADLDGNVYVADNGVGRIQKFGELPTWPPRYPKPSESTVQQSPLSPFVSNAPALPSVGIANDAELGSACRLRVVSPQIKAKGGTARISTKTARRIFKSGIRSVLEFGRVGGRPAVCKKVGMALLQKRGGHYYLPGTAYRVPDDYLTSRGFATKGISLLQKRKAGRLTKKSILSKHQARLFLKALKHSSRDRQALRNLREKQYRGSFVLIYTAQTNKLTVTRRIRLDVGRN